jgi:hypothetical protein
MFGGPWATEYLLFVYLFLPSGDRVTTAGCRFSLHPEQAASSTRARLVRACFPSAESVVVQEDHERHDEADGGLAYGSVLCARDEALVGQEGRACQVAAAGRCSKV